MALATFANLQDAVEDWLARTDLSDAQVQDLITLCESRLNKMLRHRKMIATTTLSLTGGTATVAVPSDYLEARSLVLESGTDVVLRYVTPEKLFGNSADNSTGKPLYYTVLGGNFYFSPTPDGDYSATLAYYQQLDIVSDSTNWLLTDHPDVYLYGSLMCAEAFIMNDARIPLWKQAFDEALGELNQDGDRSEMGAGSLSCNADIQVV